MNSQLLMAAITEFVAANEKDERYKDAIEQLHKVREGLQGALPEAAPSAGDRAVTAANSGKEADNVRPLPEEPAESQPKSFASASQAARERMTAEKATA